VHKPVIGRQEHVSLPEWGIANVEAKIDTGARTSAIHVEGVHRVNDNHVQFYVVTRRGDPGDRVHVEAELRRITRVRSSTGHQQERYVVSTMVRIGKHRRRIEMSLVRRERMSCRMLLGRRALEGFVVDVTRKHVHKKKIRR